jgi:energy-coupling factor transporter transmembrane protein EcfT
MNADAVRILLIIFLVTIFLVSISYLRRRKMSKLAYALWGTFALLLPAFGPFFVIAYRPGELVARKRGRQKSSMKRRSTVRK